ncbi:MAG: hypothetical protein WCD79_11240 [Chthoniobacteraceae bacterium]
MNLTELTTTISGAYGVLGIIIFLILSLLALAIALLWLLLPVLLYYKFHRLITLQQKTNELLTLLTQKR